ncbi:MAG: acyl-CoA thioesterase [Acidilobaceae archaeon]|nr:acyl-CoA thioesterase [Acidilobaceae archaeon]MCX8166084.1 acyl-CoA thioesterase [Acidilobaceae archaeon]MDW7974727.1 thioesterase family protein [Sulfolobales archaeon]
MALYSHRFMVYWSDTDAAGIAHFSNFFRWCERTEEELFRSRFGSLSGLLAEAGLAFPRVKASCNFFFPLFLHDELRVDVVEILVGEKSITYRYEIHNESKGMKSAECEIVVVPVKLSEMRSVEIPPQIKESLFSFGAVEKNKRVKVQEGSEGR